MNKNLQTHIEKIAASVDEWLKADNAELKLAIDKTVNEELYSFPDVKHRILSLKNTIHKDGLIEWANRTSLEYQSLAGKNIVCLHAGNLPLVGIQDLLAVVMTGGTYYGKLSRKDPYLMPTLLKVLRKNGLLNKSLWTSKLNDFLNVKGDAVIFAGSDQSVKPVMEKLSSYNVIRDNSSALMRTAHFSIALIEDNQPKTMKDLTEAVFRYGGAGCRSVAVVVAPFHLDSHKCSYTDYVEAFWLKNPQHEKPDDKLHYRFAYNKAVKKPQAWLNDFLIEENISEPVEKFVLYWVKGSKNNLRDIIKKYASGLQSVYVQPGSGITEVAGYKTEPLSSAQNPPIYWKPDQVDSIEWLQNNLAS